MTSTRTSKTKTARKVVPTWQQVLARSGGVCECAGECGGHMVEVGSRRKKMPEPCQAVTTLLVVPRHVGTHPATACRLPASQLLALCTPCVERINSSAGRAARGTQRATAWADLAGVTQGELFDT